MTDTNNFTESYMRLRTLLDSLTVNTLRYCLDGEDPQVKIDRVNSIEGDLLNLIQKVGGEPGEGGCDPGYFNCGGVCVPYACVQDAIMQAAE